VGKRWIAHRVPFHCSAIPSAPPSYAPTAAQSVVEAQDTAVSAVYPMRLTSGVR
jgi:hypothetical protein